MRRLTVRLFLALGIVMGVGCQHSRLGGRMQRAMSNGTCDTCAPGGDAGPIDFGWGSSRQAEGMAGGAAGAYSSRGQGIPVDVMGTGATPTVNYPYYTLRGPRDFLAKHPPSIGP